MGEREISRDEFIAGVEALFADGGEPVTMEWDEIAESYSALDGATTVGSRNFASLWRVDSDNGFVVHDAQLTSSSFTFASGREKTLQWLRRQIGQLEAAGKEIRYTTGTARNMGLL